MKIDDSMPAGAVRTRPAASAAASGTVPAKPTAADVADFLGISEAELTPNVQQGLVRLMDEVDRLRRELDIKDRRIADLERLSDEDPLAPVLNRRAFVRELTRMISAAERYSFPSSVLYFDVDGMKVINDGHGHGAGDAALTHVAGTLLGSVRPSDVVGRLGGDEFGVLLSRADRATAVLAGDRLKEAIESKPVDWEGWSLRVSVSFGVHAVDGREEPRAALNAADQAMYRQKRGAG